MSKAQVHVFGLSLYPRVNEYGRGQNFLILVYQLGEGFYLTRNPWVRHLDHIYTLIE